MLKSFCRSVGRVNVFSLLFLCLYLAGCSSPQVQNAKPLPSLTYAHLTPLEMGVKDVHVVNEYTASQMYHDVSGQFPVPPDIALNRYADHRFSAKGGPAEFFLIIEDASVLLSESDDEREWYDVFKTAALNIYEINYKVRLFLQYESGKQSDHGFFTFRKSLKVPQSLSVNERETAQLNAVEAMIKEVDSAIVNYIKTNFSSVVR